MIHILEPRCSSQPRTLASTFATMCTVIALGLIAFPSSLRAAACPGRVLLTCSEKQAMIAEGLAARDAFVLNAEPFQTPTSLPLGNAALRHFWRFEAASSAALTVFEQELLLDGSDPDFEAISPPPHLQPPVVQPRGIVDRPLAKALRSLMAQQVAAVANLIAANAALNRATTASSYRGRSDWVNWQLAEAAKFAARAAGALRGGMTAERSASRGLIRRHILFGVGSADLRLAQRSVRRSGFTSALVADMRQLTLNDAAIGYCRQTFLQASFGPSSFALSTYLDVSDVRAAQGAYIQALSHFAGRIPAATQPPS